VTALSFLSFPSCGTNVSQLRSQPVSELLVRWKGRDQQALESLVLFAYKELREIVSLERSGDLLALDDALSELSRLDEQQAGIVEMRFFGGLSIEEIGEVLDISRSSVKREWNIAKAWLSGQMKRGSGGKPPAVAKS